VVEPFRLESQGERRRAHLIAVAAHLIVTRGVDVVSHALVAEVAGCARTLVYRYFPRRTDLLYALLVAFDDDLQKRIRQEDLIEAIVSLNEAKRGRMPKPLRAVLESLWQPEDFEPTELEFRLAVIMLTRDAALGAAIGDHAAKHHQMMEERVSAPLRGLGLSPVQVAITLDTILAVQHHVTKAALAGEITRPELIDLLFHVPSRVVQTFTT
jgi:AcrR family transcriptional regulator